MTKEIIIPKGLLIVLAIITLVLTLQNLKALPPILIIIVVVLVLLTLSQKFNTRGNKLLIAKLSLLIAVTYVTIQLLGTKGDTFTLVFCVLVWLFNASIFYLDAQVTKR